MIAKWAKRILVMVTALSGQAETLEGCYFCQAGEPEIEDRLVAQGEVTRVIADRSPSVAGHLLITPNRHVVRVEQLTKAEWREMHTQLEQVQRLFRLAYDKRDALFMIRNGEGAGQRVFHVHLHCYPSSDPEILEQLVPRPCRADPLVLKREVNRLQTLWATQVSPSSFFLQREELEAKGEWRRLVELGTQALADSETNAIAKGLVHASLASYHFYLGDYPSCLTHGNASLALANEREDPDLQARAGYLVSAAYRGLGCYDEALEALGEAMAVVDQEECSPVILGKVYYNAARLELDRPNGDQERALGYWKRSVEAFKEANSPDDLCRAEIGLVRLLLKEDRVIEAAEYVLQWNDASSGPRTQVYQLEIKALLRRAQGHRQGAMELLLKAISSAESLGMVKDVSRLQTLGNEWRYR